MTLSINNQSTVVFDLDDTLYNEIDFLKSSYLAIAKELDSSNAIQLYARMFSMYRNNENVFEFIASTYNITVEELIVAYRNHIPNIKLFEHIEPLLLAIKNEGGKIAVITDGRSTTQRNKIKELGVESYLDLIIISEEIGSEKPSLKNFQMIETMLKTTHNTYIADNLKKDFIAPNLLGWNSICLIDNGKNIHKHKDAYYTIKENSPNQYIYNFKDITIAPML